MNNSPGIRPIHRSEIPSLNTMLYHAIYVPPGADKLPENIIRHPVISLYIDDFGREGDICYVAELENELVGAIWTRHFDQANPGYGFVDETTPELCMSVLPESRKQGIGTALLETMVNVLTDKGYKQVSLSVDLVNYAYDLYKKFGFKDYLQSGESMTMLLRLDGQVE